MKATGIVRRIDDLGRVVIPKEIRRTMRIREGDPLEIFTDRNGEVIFKKYSPIGELSAFVLELCESIAKVTEQTCIVCDKDHIVCSAGSDKKSMQDQKISDLIEKVMQERAIYIFEKGEAQLFLLANDEKYLLKALSPIINDGDVVGAVAMISDDASFVPEIADTKILNTSSLFLSKHMS